MRVMLINPLSGWFKYDPMGMPSLGILIVAAKLRQDGHEVAFIDRNARIFGQKQNGALINRPGEMLVKALDRKTRAEILGFKPDMVGLTVMTSQLRDARRVAALTRAACGHETLILAGGYHPTSEPVTILRDIPNLDIAVRGQGEFTIAGLANGLPAEKLPGVTYRTVTEQRGAIRNFMDYFRRRRAEFDPRFILSTADMPWSKDRVFTVRPARDLIDTAYYQREGDGVINCYYFRQPASIISSRGCPKRCAFCASVLMEDKIFFSPVEPVIQEIEELVDRDGVTGLFFYDINFPVYKKRTRSFCSAMLERGLADRVKWIACASADDLPYELLPEMRRAGCIGIVFGFESASQRVLDILNKRTAAELNQKAVDACKANDIRPQSGFIVGVPGETERDIQMSLDFIARNDLLSSLNLLLPLPGTPINRRLREMGRLNCEDPDYWGLIADTNAPITPSRVYNDLPFDRFMEIYNYGMQKVCAPTWKTIYVDKPSAKELGGL